MFSPVVLPSLVEALKPEKTPAEKLDALGQLAQIMDTSYGEDAEALCEYLRVAGCVGHIAGCLNHPEPQIHQTAMLLVGNIASEAVDPAAEKTKALLKRHRAFEKMITHLFSSDWMTLVYTLGAVQNTCTELEYVELMQEMGIVARLQELVRSGDPQLEQYAKGCLANMRQTILVSATKKQIRQATEKSAAVTMQSNARRLLAQKTAKKVKDQELAKLSDAQRVLLGGPGGGGLRGRHSAAQSAKKT